MSWYRMQPPALRAILTINVVIYVAWMLILRLIGPVQYFVLEHVALVPFLPDILFEPWQLITYNFLHLSPGFGGLLHILFNMLWLVWIGREYEQMHGSHRLLAIYLLAGIGGGLLSVLWYTVLPAGGPVVVYGASASVLGVITAVAIFYPYKSIALLFIPFPIRLIHLVIAFLALDLLFIAGSTTAIAAHLGGALTGFLFARAERSGRDLSSWARVFFDRSWQGGSSSSRRSAGEKSRTSLFRSASKSTGPGNGGGAARVTRMRSKEDASPSPSSSSEIDRILDKISEQGYEALTSEEKRLLYEASKK